MGSGLRGAGRAGLPSGTWPKIRRSLPVGEGRTTGNIPRGSGRLDCQGTAKPASRPPTSSATNCEIMTG